MSIHIHTCIFFVKLLFSVNRNNNGNVKTLKIIKKVIFVLFVLEKFKFEEM